MAGAIEPAPEHRYESCDTFADDLERAIAGRPIRRRPPSISRRTALFARREPAFTAAIIIALVAVLGGATGVIRLTTIATHERDIAQSRFDELRRFSHWVIFDLDTDLARLPQSTEVRRSVIDQAIRYLDELAADADSDNSLQLELAEARVRLAEVLGGRYNRSLGDSKAATAQYQSAATKLRPLVKRPADAASYLLARALIGEYLNSEGLDVNASAELLAEPLAIVQSIIDADPESADAWRLQAEVLDWLALYRSNRLGVPPDENEQLDSAIAAARRALELEPDSIASRRSLADTLFWKGYELRHADPRQAAPLIEQAVSRYDSLAAESEEQFLRQRGGHRTVLAVALAAAGRRGDAIRQIDPAVVLLEQGVAFDPTDYHAFRRLEIGLSYCADAMLMLAKAGDSPADRRDDLLRARALYERAHAMHQERIDRGWVSVDEADYDADLRELLEECDQLLSTTAAP